MNQGWMFLKRIFFFTPAPWKLEYRNNIWHFWALVTRWPAARTNSSDSLKYQLQSRCSSVDVWIMWNSTTHQPTWGASKQMSTSPTTRGQRSPVLAVGLFGEGHTVRWADHVALHQLGVNRPSHPPWWSSANWIPPRLISNRWSGF